MSVADREADENVVFTGEMPSGIRSGTLHPHVVSFQGWALCLFW